MPGVCNAYVNIRVRASMKGKRCPIPVVEILLPLSINKVKALGCWLLYQGSCPSTAKLLPMSPWSRPLPLLTPGALHHSYSTVLYMLGYAKKISPPCCIISVTSSLLLLLLYLHLVLQDKVNYYLELNVQSLVNQQNVKSGFEPKARVLVSYITQKGFKLKSPDVVESIWITKQNICLGVFKLSSEDLKSGKSHSFKSVLLLLFFSLHTNGWVLVDGLFLWCLSCQ